MTPEDIRKCKKNGYVWLDNCGIILRVNKGSCLWPEKNQWGMLCFHATRAAAQAAIDERVAKRKAVEANETPPPASEKWIERKIGDKIQIGDEVTDWKNGERIIAGKSIAGLPVKSSMTARYVNPLWVALQEAKKTPSTKVKQVDCFAAKPSGEPAIRITAEEQQPKISYDNAMSYARQHHRLRQVGVPEYYRIPFGCRDILDVVIDIDHPLATAIEHLYRCRHKTSDEKARDVHKAINILERWLDAGTLKTPCPF